MFDGNLHSLGLEHHSFVTDDVALNAVGMSSYTFGSMRRFLVDKPTRETRQFFGGNNTQAVFDALVGADVSKLEIIAFDKDALIYEYKSGTEIFKNKEGVEVASSLEQLILNHNTNQWGITEADGNTSYVVQKIQSSLSGCITFNAQFSVNIGERSIDRNPVIKVYFKDRNNSSTERSLAQNNPPLVCAVPKRPTGAAYGWQGSQNQPIGVYQNPSEGDNNNPANAVAANIRLTYNPAIGEWESGTQQMLARLLTDVDAAPINEIPVDSIDSIDPSEFYDTNSNAYMGQFTTGKAIPISLEAGNPHMVGPNILAGSNGSNKKEKIMVVNRSPRPFKKGDVVMCSHIDGEWIMQGFDSAEAQKQPLGLKIGKWSFAKFLADSDSFFKDERFKNFAISREAKYSQPIIGRDYEDRIRLKYYAHMFTGGGDDAAPAIKDVDNILPVLREMNDLNKIAKINLHNPREKENKPRYDFDKIDEEAALLQPMPFLFRYDFIPTSRYVQTTAFDQVGTHMGGTNQYNIIGRTNVKYSPDGTTNSTEWYQSNFPNFWGPVFTEGFTSQASVALSQPSPMSPFMGSNRLGKVAGTSVFLSSSDGTEILSTSLDKNKTVDSNNFMFANQTDGSLRQLPAEIGTNGPPESSTSSPIESLDELVAAERANENLLDVFDQFFKSRKRYVWLAGPSGENVYGFAPANSSKIQFSPLQLEYATHAYIPTSSADIQKYNNLKAAFSSTLSTNSASNQNVWGNLIPGSPGVGNVPTRGIAPFPSIGPDTVSDGDGPIGGPNLLPRSDLDPSSEKSNFVGIVIAKNKFTGTGSVLYTCEQYFGLPKVQTVAGGQTGSVTILPIGGGIGWVGPSNPSFTSGFPQWGSASDDPNSFGTTALHVRIFDQWPDEQTIFDPRYFGILHFNPLPASGINTIRSRMLDENERPNIRNWKPTDPLPRYPRSVDIADSSVDLRVPTYAHPSNTSLDNQPIPLGARVTKDGINGAALRPENEWRINPIRRGRLLTGSKNLGGGFRYYRRVIGVSDAFVLQESGEGYEQNEEIQLQNNVKVKVKSIGEKGAITSLEVIERGEGFTPNDFDDQHQPIVNGVKVTYYGRRMAIGSKKGVIIFLSGVVYDKLSYDPCPLESTEGYVRITASSSRGERATEGTSTASVGLNGSGKYDAFYFFHNDILHTVLNPGAFIPGFHQYVNLTIGAG